MPAAAEAQALHQAGRLREAARLLSDARRLTRALEAAFGRHHAGLRPAAIKIPA